jgi:hypothetical protein
MHQLHSMHLLGSSHETHPSIFFRLTGTACGFVRRVMVLFSCIGPCVTLFFVVVSRLTYVGQKERHLRMYFSRIWVPTFSYRPRGESNLLQSSPRRTPPHLGRFSKPWCIFEKILGADYNNQSPMHCKQDIILLLVYKCISKKLSNSKLYLLQ